MGETAAEIVTNDLNHICQAAADELHAIAGKRLLITGGAGFPGHYLVQAVTHFNRTANSIEPIRLTVVDNFARGVPAWLTRLEAYRALALLRHDMAKPLPQGLGDYEYIVHAASVASPAYYRRDPIGTMDANVNGLRNLLDHFLGQTRRGRNALGFLFFSGSEVYGDPDPANIPTREDYRGFVSCTGPRACYDEAKRYGETLCVNFARHHGLPVKVARPFNNYGPGLTITDAQAIPGFARDVLSGQDIVMLSDGSATRTFCYVADAVVGYYKLLVRGRPGEAYNVGTEKPEISMRDLAERIAGLSRGLFGYQGKVVRKASADADHRVDRPDRRCPAIEKARKDLSFNPAIALDEGLRRSLIWYGGNREADPS